MCGICGILRVSPDAPPIDQALLDRMTDTLRHRGPNDRGTLVDGRVGLGHRRLSVIDLSRAGRQPMGNESGDVQIVYNGEVYNFAELRTEYRLDSRGHQFRSRTDTEVLVHLYEEIGLDMVSKLNGMFAAAIWDARTGELHLIRDRFGIKPLFYQHDGHHFRFGSEIKAILADDRVKREVDVQALHDYLTFDYVPGPQTAFVGIKEVPPAHCMTIRANGSTDMRRYWDLPCDSSESGDQRSVIREISNLMDVAVRRRLIADVPIGVLLSGGLDSSAIVALMHEHTDEPIHTYSVGFEQSSFNELPFARMVSQRFGAVAREVVVTADMIRGMLPKYLSYIDEPYADGSAIPTYFVCELAKDEVVVVLSGEGGDEAMAGYETYTAHKVSRWFGRIPRWVRRGLIAPLVNALPVSDKKLSLEFKLKRFMGGQDLSAPQAHVWWRVVLTEAQKRSVYTPQTLERITHRDSDRFFREAFGRCGAADALDRLLYADANVFLPDDLMIKNDRMSMAHSLEARVPFTDPELTEFMSRVPASRKLPGLRKKHLMRAALRGRLPDAVLNKKKVGLEIPYSAWLRTELNEILMHYCGRDSIEDTGLFRPDAIQTLIDEHMQRRRDNGRALWGLLNYMMWYDLYIRN